MQHYRPDREFFQEEVQRKKKAFSRRGGLALFAGNRREAPRDEGRQRLLKEEAPQGAALLLVIESVSWNILSLGSRELK